jgi:hypothetical protein
MYIDRDKTRKMLAFVEGEHFRYRRKTGAEPRSNELALATGTALILDAPETPLVARLQKDFCRFFTTCMGVALHAWSAGLQIVQKALGRQPNRRAIMELDVGRTILAHLRTTWNVVRFYRVRDAFFGSAGSDAVLCRRMAQLQAVLNDEIENARSFLPIVERDFRIGYGRCYGQVYDADMIREKIEQCVFVRDVELPRLKSGIRFHIDGTYKVG